MFRPVKVPKNQDPLVKFIFEQVNEKEIPIKELCKKAGYDASTLRKWRTETRFVTLHAVQSFLQILGYRLVLEKIDGNKKADKAG